MYSIYIYIVPLLFNLSEHHLTPNHPTGHHQHKHRSVNFYGLLNDDVPNRIAALSTPCHRLYYLTVSVEE